ncbi:MAG: hypothetical protein K2I91_01185, partial [Muribaculaceae bacterium]|nr:hypothetical protein [Muribaculaceae bacterium]
MYPEQSVINGADIPADSAVSDSAAEITAGIDSTREWGLVFSKSEEVVEVSRREPTDWRAESLIL